MQSKIPVYAMGEGIRHIIALTNQKFASGVHPVLIEIRGGSGSGKTSVAQKLKEAFGDDAAILSLDDYYKQLSFFEEQKKLVNPINTDQPEAFEMSMYIKHLLALKSGATIKKPIYDLNSGRKDDAVTVVPRKAVIAEGLFAISAELAVYGDIRVFVETGREDRMKRRTAKFKKITTWSESSMIEYFHNTVEPMHKKYVEPTKDNADLIIRN